MDYLIYLFSNIAIIGLLSAVVLATMRFKIISLEISRQWPSIFFGLFETLFRAILSGLKILSSYFMAIIQLFLIKIKPLHPGNHLIFSHSIGRYNCFKFGCKRCVIKNLFSQFLFHIHRPGQYQFIHILYFIQQAFKKNGGLFLYTSFFMFFLIKGLIAKYAIFLFLLLICLDT